MTNGVLQGGIYSCAVPAAKYDAGVMIGGYRFRSSWRLAFLFGAIAALPALMAGCFRSDRIIDQLEIGYQGISSGWGGRWASADGHLSSEWGYSSWTPDKYSNEAHARGWSLKYWQDRDHDAKDIVLLFKWQAFNGPGLHTFELSLGYPGLILFDSTFIFWWFVRQRQIQRELLKSQRICVVCGYDLRATPERCPECGTAAGKAVP